MNVNTVNLEVLSAVCAFALGGDIDGGSSLAEKIIAYRFGTSENPIENDQAFLNLDELGSGLVDGVTPSLLGQMKEGVKLGVKSENFTVFSRGRFGKAVEKVSISTASARDSKPTPTAHIVAQCHRSALIYEDSAFKESPGFPPGYKRTGRSGISMVATQVAKGTMDYFQWFLPVVCVKRWISY